MDKEAVGVRVFRIRKTLALSPDEFASLVGCSGFRIAKIESGRAKLSVEDVIELFEKVSVNVHWLLTGEERCPAFDSPKLRKNTKIEKKVYIQSDQLKKGQKAGGYQFIVFEYDGVDFVLIRDLLDYLGLQKNIVGFVRTKAFNSRSFMVRSLHHKHRMKSHSARCIPVSQLKAFVERLAKSALPEDAREKLDAIQKDL